MPPPRIPSPRTAALHRPVPVTIRSGSGDIDVIVTAAVDTTLRDVFDVVELDAEGGAIAGRPIDGDARWRSLPIGPGTVIDARTSAAAGAATSSAAQGRSDDVVELRQIAGLAAGGVVTLAPGVYRAGEVLATAASLHFGRTADSATRLVVPHSGPCWIVDSAGRRSSRTDGLHQVGTAVFATAPVDGAAGPAQSRPRAMPVGSGPVRIARPPRHHAPPLDTAIAVPESTVVIPSAPDFSWAMVLAPLPIGLLMAIMFRPIFALFAVMGPVAGLARYIEGRVAAELAPVVDGLSQVRAARSRAEHPSVDELAAWARLRGDRLWERRRTDADFLCMAVGHVDRPWEPSFDPDPPEKLAEAIGRRAVDRLAPATVDLSESRAIGIVGARFEALAVARALVLSAATLHGPSDLRLRLACEPTFRRDWDWLKWVPHIESVPDGGSLVHDTASIRSVSPRDDAHELLVVDDGRINGGEDPVWREYLDSDRRVQLVIADRVAALPAHCGAIVELSAPGTSLFWPQLGTGIESLLPRGITDAFARDWATTLAPLVDPDLSFEHRLPARARLRNLLADDLEPDAIVARWTSGSPRPRFPIGVGADGPLIIDLDADGPHALIAGTTGSGKSELLRSLVVGLAAQMPPDRLTFVLIDFKGGEAFDACVGLPHVGAVVTDLDENLASRALQSLNAELRRREELLRASASTGIDAHNASADAPRGTSAAHLARLVVVIDEFATLAAELPDFLDALVDVAQRGRSLGVHLVLATQRPSGVLDNKIRANTNIRIALRVQAAHDSVDVLGSGEAAEIDRRLPGRAWVRLGADDIAPFQTASVSLPVSGAAPAPFGVEPFDLTTGAQARNRDLGPSADDGGRVTDLAQIVRSLVAAGRRLDRPIPSPPWLPPLGVTIMLDAVAEAPLPVGTSDDGLAVDLGIADDPAAQDQFRWQWRPERGPLLAVSSHPGDGPGTSRAIVATLARLPTACHVWVIDGSGAALGELGELPFVGAVVEGGDVERLERLLDLIERPIADDVGAGPRARAHRFLGIDDYGAVAEALTAAQRLDLLDRIGRVMASPVAEGSWSVWVTARNERAVPNRLLVHFTTRLIGKLADRAAYAVLGMIRRNVPVLSPLRYVDTELDLEVQIATVDPDEFPDALSGPLTDPVEPGPQPVPVLPGLVTVDDLRARGAVLSRSGGVVHVPIGLATTDLSPVALRLEPERHLLVVGAAATGRTSLLRHLVASLASADSPIPMITIAPRGSIAGSIAVDGAGTEVEDGLRAAFDNAVAAATTAPGVDRIVVIVDDADAVPTPIAEHLVRFAAQSPTDRIGLTIVAAAPPEVLRRRTVWTAQVNWSDRGVLLAPRPGDGEVFGVDVRRNAPATPGRGGLVEGRTMRDVLFALPSPPDSSADG